MGGGGGGSTEQRTSSGPRGRPAPGGLPAGPVLWTAALGHPGRLCQNRPRACRQPTSELFSASLLGLTGNSEAARLRLSKTHRT